MRWRAKKLICFWLSYAAFRYQRVEIFGYSLFQQPVLTKPDRQRRVDTQSERQVHTQTDRQIDRQRQRTRTRKLFPKGKKVQK